MTKYICVMCKQPFTPSQGRLNTCSESCNGERRSDRAKWQILLRKNPEDQRARKEVERLNAEPAVYVAPSEKIRARASETHCRKQRQEALHAGRLSSGDPWKTMDELKYGMSNCCPLDTYSSMDVGYGL